MVAKCPPMRAHWRQLANMTELVHPSAHLSLQPKQQMDRFSRFSTANGRKCLYFAMGAPIHQNCPSGPPSNTIPWAMRTQNPNGTSISSAVFAQMTVKCPYTLQWFAHFPLKIAPSHGMIWTPCNTRFLGPTPVLNPNGNSSASAVLQGSLV